MIKNQLEIRVFVEEGKTLTSATVTAVPEAIGTSATAEFDPLRRIYFFEGLRPGFFTVTVEHAGYELQTRRIQVHPKPTRTTFVLEGPDSAYTFRGSARVPYKSEPELIGIIPAFTGSPVTEEAQSFNQLLQTLGLTPETVDVTGERVEGTGAMAPTIPGALVVRRTRGPLESIGNDDLRTLRESPLVAAAGPLFQRSAEALAIFTNQLFVRFRPEVTRAEAEQLLADEDLTIVQPLGFAPSLFLVEADASIGEGINRIAERLLATGRVEYAEPNMAEIPEYDAIIPTDYLWPGLWDRQRVQVHYAWQRLCTDLGEDFKFGRPDIIIAVVDSGIKSVAGIPENPDFQGTVSDGSSKIYQLFDFHNWVANNDKPYSDHGVACAGVASGVANNLSSDSALGIGAAGAAPNTRLIGLIRPFDEAISAKMYLWAAGFDPQWTVEDLRKGPEGAQPPQPVSPGADIFTTSSGIGGAPLCGAARDMLDCLTRRGRKGKGCLAFFSAGNGAIDCDTWEVEYWRPYGAYERSFSCAASTLDDTGLNEVRAPYSGWGLVEWCAPSHDDYVEGFDHLHNPPKHYATWTAAFRGNGNLPACPLFETALTAEIPTAVRTNTSSTVYKESTILNVDSSHGFAVDQWIRLVDELSGEWVQITGIPSSDQLEVTETTGFYREGCPVLGESTICVEDTSGISADQWILIDTPGAAGCEPVLIRKIVASANQLYVSGPLNAHASETSIVGGENDFRNDFGGTSSATPLCAGIAALVLSAQPDLTWVEAREILRKSADQLDTSNTDPVGQWLDANAKPSVKTGLSPVFSHWYGYGRLNANLAVADALKYDFPRDLVIRNNLSDDGEKPATPYTDSPDIWVRNADPANDPAALPASYCVAGPHQIPRRDRPRWIYARIRNRGTDASLDAWVRFYVASSHKAPFEHPQDWEPQNGIGNIAPDLWEPGTYFIGEVALPSIAPGADMVVNIPWPDELMPPPLTPDGGVWQPNLLVEITPPDGPLTGAQIRENNNLAQKAILKRPVLYITPRELLDFGDVAVNYARYELIRVYNAGRETLDVRLVNVETDEEFLIRVPGGETGMTLAPKEKRFIRVDFLPSEVELYRGELTFESSDPDKPQVEIDLHGTGMPWLWAQQTGMPWGWPQLRGLTGHIKLNEWDTLTADIWNIANVALPPEPDFPNWGESVPPLLREKPRIIGALFPSEPEKTFPFLIDQVSVDVQGAQAEFKAVTTPEVPFLLKPRERFKLEVDARPTALGWQNASVDILCVWKPEGHTPWHWLPDLPWEKEVTWLFELPVKVKGE